MSVSVQEIYNVALDIMDESDNETYRKRTPSLINTLMGRCWMMSENHKGRSHSTWKKVSAMSDMVLGIDSSLALSAMPYGLAAQLYMQEDPVSAQSWWDIFQENAMLFWRSQPAEFEDITDSYGGVEFDEFGRW